MTAYFLHGGNTTITNDKLKVFLNSIIDNALKPYNVLFIPFSIEKMKWTEAFKKFVNNFQRSVNKHINFSLADPNISIFTQQIKDARILYLVRGSEILLKPYLEKVKRLDILLCDKLIVGTSAGTNIISTYYYSNDRQQIESGIGLLPIKTICHYDESKKDKLKELINYGNRLDVYPIREGEFIKLLK